MLLPFWFTVLTLFYSKMKTNHSQKVMLNAKQISETFKSVNLKKNITSWLSKSLYLILKEELKNKISANYWSFWWEELRNRVCRDSNQIWGFRDKWQNLSHRRNPSSKDSWQPSKWKLDYFKKVLARGQVCRIDNCFGNFKVEILMWSPLKMMLLTFSYLDCTVSLKLSFYVMT